MYRVLCGLTLMLFAASLVGAQEAPTVSQHYKPGDPLHYTVTFAGDPELTNLSLSFGLKTDASPPRTNERGFNTAFGLSEIHKTGPGIYEVSGQIPDNIRSGTYVIDAMQANHGNQSKGYQA